MSFIPRVLLLAILLAVPSCMVGDADEPDDADGFSVEPNLYCGGYVTVFEDANYQGANLAFCKGNYPDLRNHSGGLSSGKNWNDRISSWRGHCDPNKWVTLFDDINYGGGSVTTKCNSSLGYYLFFNDHASSMRVGCTYSGTQNEENPACTSNSQCCSGTCANSRCTDVRGTIF